MMQTIRSIPRAALTGYVRALRTPLSVAERVVGQRGNDRWPPNLAFEALEARLETFAGSLLRDHDLLETGQQRDAKVVKLKEAQALKDAARYEATKAREEERSREAEIAREREQVDRKARERKAAIEAKAEKDKQAAEARAAKRKKAVAEQEAAQETVIERRERAAKAAALRAESEAIDLTDEALEAQDKVDLIDATLEGNKEARKTG